MGAQFRVRRRIATVPIVAGGFATVDLPRGYDFETLFLRINASVAVSAAAATSVRSEAPCQLISRIDVTADGKTQVFSAPFWYACLGSFDRALTETNARAVTPPSGVAVATYAVEAIGCVDFATVDGLRPKDSNLRTSGMSLFQLRLQFGLAEEIFVKGAATVAFSGSPTVEIWSSESVEVPDAARQLPPIPFLKKVSYQDIAFPSSNSAAEIRLPAGNLLRSVLLRTEGSTTAGEPSTSVLNAMRVQSGVDIRADLTGPQWRAQNNADYGYLQGGYYVADMCSLGASPQRLAELFDVSRQAEPKVILDVTGAANVRAQLVTMEYIPAV